MPEEVTYIDQIQENSRAVGDIEDRVRRIEDEKVKDAASANRLHRVGIAIVVIGGLIVALLYFLSDVNECLANPCINIWGDFQCLCPPQWTRKPCSIEWDICGKNGGKIVCYVCDKKPLWDSCDKRWHSHPRRPDQQRFDGQPTSPYEFGHSFVVADIGAGSQREKGEKPTREGPPQNVPLAMTIAQAIQFRRLQPCKQPQYEDKNARRESCRSWPPGTAQRPEILVDTGSFDTDIKLLEEEKKLLKQMQICIEKSVSIIFLPCGHLLCCEDCDKNMRKCPFCRKRINGQVRAVCHRG